MKGGASSQLPPYRYVNFVKGMSIPCNRSGVDSVLLTQCVYWSLDMYPFKNEAQVFS